MTLNVNNDSHCVAHKISQVKDAWAEIELHEGSSISLSFIVFIVFRRWGLSITVFRSWDFFVNGLAMSFLNGSTLWSGQVVIVLYPLKWSSCNSSTLWSGQVAMVILFEVVKLQWFYPHKWLSCNGSTLTKSQVVKLQWFYPHKWLSCNSSTLTSGQVAWFYPHKWSSCNGSTLWSG